MSKLGRWFSWNGSAEHNLECFSAFKMILEDHLDGCSGPKVGDPDLSAIAFDDLRGIAAAKTPYAQVQKLKEEGGGLRFLYKLCTNSLRLLCIIIAEVTRPCWNWYTQNTTKCKTAQHAVDYASAMVQGWCSDAHLKDTLRHSLYNAETLNKCQVGAGTTAVERTTMHRLMDFSWHLTGERLGSLAARHSVPPDCYAGTLRSRQGGREEAIQVLGRHAQNVYWLDRRRHTDELAKELWQDCVPVSNKPVRLLWAFFERDGPDSEAGLKLLRGLVQTPPDNKAVEELHHTLKSERKKRKQAKQTSPEMQHLILASDVLENHGFPHAARLKLVDWRRNWPRRKQFQYKRQHHMAKCHKLPSTWSSMMGQKLWRTTTEIEGRISASAWQWLQVVGPHQSGPVRGCEIGQALFSRLLLPKLVFKYMGAFWASMTRGKWGSLAWPLLGEAHDGGFRFKFDVGPNAEGQWHHVLDVDAYVVVPCVEEMSNRSLYLRAVGVEEPLAKAALRQAKNLSFVDLERLATHYGLVPCANRKRMLEMLARHFGADDVDFIEQVITNDLSPDKGADLLAQDPFFEMAFDELEIENRQELRDVKQALDRHKSRSTAIARGVKRKVAARAKSKAVAKAKTGPAPPVAKAAPPAIDAKAAPPVKAAAPPVAPKAAPMVVPKALPIAFGAGLYGGSYEYIEYAGGHIVFSEVLQKINFHCKHVLHQTMKCHMDRSIPSREVDFAKPGRTKGRPLGLGPLWLQMGDQANVNCCADKAAHDLLKATLAEPHYHEQRKNARKNLWNRRFECPEIVRLFAVEADISNVPLAVLNGIAPELWEPVRPF